MHLAKRLRAARPSPTLALNARARAMALAGADIVSFAAGEPDFDTPVHIRDAAKEALDQGYTRYTPTGGLPELKAAIVDKFKRDNQLEYTADQVIVTVGAKQALYNSLQALISPGDEVIIFSPYWVSYPEMIRLADGVPVVVAADAEEGWVPDPRELRKVLSSRTRAIILNSPGNPSGAVCSRAALERIAEAVRGHDCAIISDDIYERLLYVPGGFSNIVNVAPELLSRTVVVNGLSKAYSMTGWRLGYAAGPKEVIAAMTLVQDQSTSNAAAMVQRAAVAALSGPQAPIDRMVAEFKARRDVMVGLLNQIPGVKCPAPDGAFYCLAQVGALVGRSYQGHPVTGTTQLSEILLEDFQVAVVPGDAFGADGYLRFSFATSTKQIEKGLKRVAELAAALK
jgi:aspartate aminotransferase